MSTYPPLFCHPYRCVLAGREAALAVLGRSKAEGDGWADEIIVYHVTNPGRCSALTPPDMDVRMPTFVAKMSRALAPHVHHRVVHLSL